MKGKKKKEKERKKEKRKRGKRKHYMDCINSTYTLNDFAVTFRDLCHMLAIFVQKERFTPLPAVNMLKILKAIISRGGRQN